MDAPALYNFTPLVQMLVLGAVLAMGPLAWWWLRHRATEPAPRLRALTMLTLFLTFDLVLFGAFTRLTDSGLGCPDWPGCYGSASPFGAHSAIQAAQTALPSGPVTHRKAWIEMVHRYLATGVGVLITVLAMASWWEARRRRAVVSPWWATATLVWVCVQGAFGALTVTMKLYPAIVSAHLLGGLGLLALLAAQSEAYAPERLTLSRRVWAATLGVFILSVVQIGLGAWVSTNYAVLACTDFPQCQGAWWPAMDFEQGFTVLRALGMSPGGDMLAFSALTAIHWTHRLGALILFIAVASVAWQLFGAGSPTHRRWAGALLATVVWQFLSGLGNVVLGWPLAAALAHTAGAAVLIVLLTTLLARAHPVRRFSLATA